MTTLVLLSLLTVYLPGSAVRPQEPSQPGPPAPASNQEPEAVPSGTPEAKGIPTRTIPGFLIVGTVFNEKALSFPGIEVRVQQKDEKKHHWQTYTNSRGEFAVRVPEGHQYEVSVRAKKYKEVVQEVSSRNGDNQQRLSIKLEPVAKAKKGAQP
jgi:hypothetical protein